MRISILNLSLFLLLLNSCAKPIIKGFVEKETDPFVVQNLYFDNEVEDYVYKAKLNVLKNSFGGILIVKKIKQEHYRVVFTTEFGNTIFDFEWIQDKFQVNQILSNMDKEFIIKFLKNDLQLLFKRDIKVVKRFDNEGNIVAKAFKQNKFTNYYFFDTNLNRLTKIVQAKHNKPKVSIDFLQIQKNISRRIVMNHHNINLNMELIFIGD